MSSPPCESRQPSHHILIGGTGRAGTTLLVQLFSALGLNTGYTIEQAKSQVDRFSNAGLERRLGEADLPYIVKSPWLADELDAALEAGDVVVDAAIVPIRSLYAAAESRRNVFREAAERGENPLQQPGTLWKTEEPETQELHLAVQFYRFLFPLVVHQIPIYFLEFPRFARDVDYLLDVLGDLLANQGASTADVREAFRSVARPNLITNFGGGELDSGG